MVKCHELSTRTRSCRRFDDAGLCHARDTPAARREGTPKGPRKGRFGANVNLATLPRPYLGLPLKRSPRSNVREVFGSSAGAGSKKTRFCVTHVKTVSSPRLKIVKGACSIIESNSIMRKAPLRNCSLIRFNQVDSRYRLNLDTSAKSRCRRLATRSL